MTKQIATVRVFRRREVREVRKVLDRIIVSDAPFSLREAAAYWFPVVACRMEVYDAQQTAAVLLNAGTRQPVGLVGKRLQAEAARWGAHMRSILHQEGHF